MAIFWTELKPLLQGLDGKQPRFDAAVCLAELDELLSSCDLCELMIAGYGKSPKKSLAELVYETGNIDAVKLFNTHAARFPARTTSPIAMGPESFPFPFPVSNWPQSTALEGIKAWGTLLLDRHTVHHSVVVKQALQNGYASCLTWLLENGLWKQDNAAALALFKDLLDMPANDATRETYLDIIDEGFQTLNAQMDMRTHPHVGLYVIGCARNGIINCPLRSEGLKELVFTSGHDRLIFQQKLGSWRDWAGKGKPWITATLKALAQQHAQPSHHLPA